jgi:hypothetical protein
MKCPVHVLATCRKPELSPMTRMVFGTLRTGFPTNPVVVHLNHDCESNCPEILSDCQQVGATVKRCEVIHHTWIEWLVMSNADPFYLLDTDVIFYDDVESWQHTKPLAGYLTPEWADEYTGCITRSRLHPSLLYVDPEKVRAGISAFQKSVPSAVFTPIVNLFYPLVLPLNGRNYFYDTLSLLYHHLGGELFTDAQKDAYFHFHFGTISDLVLPRMNHGTAIAQERNAILQQPSLGRGKWRVIEEGYASRQFIEPGQSVIAPVNAEDARQASDWNFKMCKGNSSAMEFNDLYYHYCHGVDDLIDTMRDGRPLMNREQIVSLFFKAAMVYNHPFFVAYRHLLFPIALQTTNTYADSVAWEKSSKPHLRAMGDVFRTCGNEMYFMVALICGGEAHMRMCSQLIKERDWLRQHDEHGNPI